MRKLVLAASLLVFTGCLFGSSRMVKQDSTLASVDGRTISVASLDSTIRQLQKNYPTTSYDTLKYAAMDSLIAHRLIDIRMDSIKQHLNNDWDFRVQRETDIEQNIFKVLYEKQIAVKVTVDSAEVVQYYAEHGDKFMEPERVKASHILIRRPKPDTAGVKSEKERKKILDEGDKFALKRAQAVLDKALAGENWDTLAATYSEDKTNAAKGGALGYFAHGKMMPEFDSASFAATPGTIVGPVSTKFGYHVIRVEEHLMPQQKPLDQNLDTQIRTDISNDKQKQLAQAYLDSLKAVAVLTYNEDALALPDSTVDPKTWIMAVNGTDTVFQKTVLESIPKYKRWKGLDSLTAADKKDMLGVLSSSYMLRSAARKLGYMNEPEVVKALDDATGREANLGLSRFMKVLDYEPSDSEVENYFNTHQEKYIETRPLHVYHIIFQDSAAAEVVRDSILAGADFGDMAKRHYPGEPEIREVAYNLDYIGPDDMGRDFYAAAEKLKVGEVSHPVKTAWGYHLIKLISRKEDRTLAQVRPGIKQTLKDQRNAEKAANFIAEWKKGAVIKVNEKLLKNYETKDNKVIHIESSAPKPKEG